MNTSNLRLAMRNITHGIRLLLLAAFCLSACEGSSPVSPQGNDLVTIPVGWFAMGENDGRLSNMPQRLVFLDAYQIQRHEVTRGEFAVFLQDTGYDFMGGEIDSLNAHPDLPVTNTLWEDAGAYCHWAGMRLPTEAEWEKAARGDDGRPFPWGWEWNPGMANTVEIGLQEVQVVGSYPRAASPYGLLDMCGNAAEWVADYYDRDYYRYAPDRNPTGPFQVLDHGLRGGSYDDPREWATTYFRNSSHSAKPNPRAGFRCARSIMDS